MRLAIVEDHAPLLENLKIILAGERDISIVGAYESAEKTLATLSQAAPDVVLADLGLPQMSGIEMIRRIKAQMPRTDILVYTVFDDWRNVFAALKAGATGYILKGTSPRELIEAITSLHEGGAPMSPKIARMVITEFHDERAGDTNALTSREREILSGMEKRMTYRELAVQLSISPFTVRTHIKNIYEKLQAKNKEEAIRKARRDGVL